MMKFLKKDVADLLFNGLQSHAFARMEGLIVEMNQASCSDMIEQYCEYIVKQLNNLQKERKKIGNIIISPCLNRSFAPSVAPEGFARSGLPRRRLSPRLCVSLPALHLFSPAHAEHLQPPYPSAARIADSAYFPWYTASLKCLEANQDKSKCQQQFDDYKECKKKEIFKEKMHQQ
ncbi:uncharacterized protein C2845_PM05G18040 [Panicum miliaceum]|uniref:CHCH domain-containing protein n=1 Tax=Panicum miliaceum TaxID=4540 RepID=A0A3L6T2W1_PANMI|nr:uncharacterized protein C2845_PM05G18040 [Panicum miliaceum]